MKPMSARGPLCLAILCLGAATAFAQAVIQTIPTEPETDWHKSGFWESIDGQPVEKSWEFVESELRLVNPRGGNGSLLSPPLPSNFELSWQWKIEQKTNTGLKYRVRQFGNRWLGIEYQIIDEPIGVRAQDKGSTASIYDLVAPAAEKPLRPVGQWNDAHVVAIGNRIEHFLNGSLVASTTTDGPAWDLQIALSKFFGAERFGQPGQQDRIMLTDHGGKASFRNFKFVAHQLPAGELTPQQTPAAPFLGNAIRNGWADQDSIVLWTRTTARPEMVTDGPQFREISSRDASKLAKLRDAEHLLRTQLPEGASLDEMFGACPGAAGEVRLTYFPTLKRASAKTTDWQATNADNDFTAQWKLEGLQSDKEYASVVEARPIGGGDVTAVIRGAFRTAPRQNRQRT